MLAVMYSQHPALKKVGGGSGRGDNVHIGADYQYVQLGLARARGPQRLGCRPQLSQGG